MVTELPDAFVIGAQSTRLLADPAAAAALFRVHRVLLCPRAIEPSFLASLLRLAQGAPYEFDLVDDVGSREIDASNRVGAALAFALRRPEFVRWVEQVTGCGTLQAVEGRVAQLCPNEGHGLGWHDDLNVPERRLAVTIDLTSEPYQGGLFQMRKKGSEEILFEFRHAAPGSLLIFGLSPALEHRVLPVTAGGPRRNFAGWFLSKSRG